MGEGWGRMHRLPFSRGPCAAELHAGASSQVLTAVVLGPAIVRHPRQKLAQQAVQVEVEVDLTATTRPYAFKHYWKRIFGSGHAALTVRPDWQDHLKQAVSPGPAPDIDPARLSIHPHLLPEGRRVSGVHLGCTHTYHRHVLRSGG